MTKMAERPFLFDIESFAVKIPVMAFKGMSADFLNKKAFEISYALFRVAATIKSRNFADILEEKATNLLNSSTAREYEEAAGILRSIDYFMRLGSNVSIIHPRNAEIIIKESGNMISAIAALPEETKLSELNLDPLFSKLALSEKEIIGKASKKSRAELPENKRIAGKDLPESDKLPEEEERSLARTGLRQSAIFEHLSGKGDCRLSDLQEFFPDISERTLRYDLESLISENRVERIGGGRNSFYRLKSRNGGPEVIELPGVAAGGGFTEAF